MRICLAARYQKTNQDKITEQIEIFNSTNPSPWVNDDVLLRTLLLLEFIQVRKPLFQSKPDRFGFSSTTSQGWFVGKEAATLGTGADTGGGLTASYALGPKENLINFITNFHFMIFRKMIVKYNHKFFLIDRN